MFRESRRRKHFQRQIRDNSEAFRTEARFRPIGGALSFYGPGEGTPLEQVRIAMTADNIRSLLMPGSAPTLDIRLGGGFESREGGYIGGPREFFELEAMTMVTEHGARKPRSYSSPGLQMPFFLEKNLRRLEISCSK